jgi:hypothetical protein
MIIALIFYFSELPGAPRVSAFLLAAGAGRAGFFHGLFHVPIVI